MKHTSVQVCIAFSVGVFIPYIGMSLFGYFVAYPFPASVLRSDWLIPLLRLTAWVPLIFIAAFALSKRLSNVFYVGLAIAAAFVSFAVMSLEYLRTDGIESMLEVFWPEVIFIGIVFPFATMVANKSLNTDAARRLARR
jgi:hypothetical protein